MNFEHSISGTELGNLYQSEGEVRWLIEGLLPLQCLYIVGGAPKKNKSCIVQEMMLACATGTPAFGVFPVQEPIRVLYLQEESSPIELRERVDWLLRGRGSSWDDLGQLQLYQGTLRLDAGDIHVEEIIESYVREWGAKLVVFDSLRMFHECDEDKSGEMELVLTRLKRIRNAGATVICVHHTTKQGDSTSSNPRPFRTLRGSNAIWAAADAGLMVSPTRGGDSIANVRKRKLTFDRRQGMIPEAAILTITYEENSIVFDWDGKFPRRSTATSGDLSSYQRAILHKLSDLRGADINCLADALVTEDRPTVGKNRLREELNSLADAGYVDKRKLPGRSHKLWYELTVLAQSSLHRRQQSIQNVTAA
jgi:archaellum biogenesis ATPase FlaH